MNPELTTLAWNASLTLVVRSLLNELAPDAATAPAASQRAGASGASRIHQAGRDLRITDR